MVVVGNISQIIIDERKCCFFMNEFVCLQGAYACSEIRNVVIPGDESVQIHAHERGVYTCLLHRGINIRIHPYDVK